MPSTGDTAAWSAAEGRRKERRSKTIVDAPSFGDALSTGAIGAEHVDALANATAAVDDAVDTIATRPDAIGLIELVTEQRPGLVVLDIRMPSTHTTECLEAAVAIRQTSPGVAVLLLSQHVETRYAIDPTVVGRLVGRQRRNNPLDVLTDREREVLERMAEGRSNAAIASTPDPTERTVESHVRNLFTKLDLLPEADDHRRVRAVLLYLQSLGA